VGGAAGASHPTGPTRRQSLPEAAQRPHGRRRTRGAARAAAGSGFSTGLVGRAATIEAGTEAATVRTQYGYDVNQARSQYLSTVSQLAGQSRDPWLDAISSAFGSIQTGLSIGSMIAEMNK
jgi:hypothetical protein